MLLPLWAEGNKGSAFYTLFPFHGTQGDLKLQLYAKIVQVALNINAKIDFSCFDARWRVTSPLTEHISSTFKSQPRASVWRDAFLPTKAKFLCFTHVVRKLLSNISLSNVEEKKEVWIYFTIKSDEHLNWFSTRAYFCLLLHPVPFLHSRPRHVHRLWLPVSSHSVMCSYLAGWQHSAKPHLSLRLIK